MGGIDLYLQHNYKIIKKITPTFQKVVSEFSTKSELYLKSIDFDAILMQLFAQYKEKHYDGVISNIETRVSKSCKKINATSEDYQKYLFDYLEKLNKDGENDPTRRSIYNAHRIGKPLNITDNYIRYHLLCEDCNIDKLTFERLMSTIIAINYIKERCGDIMSEKIEANNPFEINVKTPGRELAIMLAARIACKKYTYKGIPKFVEQLCKEFPHMDNTEIKKSITKKLNDTLENKTEDIAKIKDQGGLTEFVKTLSKQTKLQSTNVSLANKLFVMYKNKN